MIPALGGKWGRRKMGGKWGQGGKWRAENGVKNGRKMGSELF
jgi:hypothetical protein